MAKPIQAGSLATIIDLADNPPDQPLHTADLQQPLVLYIAHVFLTTMKPQQKIVTAQDVQSSLYYMHLDRLEDNELLSSVEDCDDLPDEDDGCGKPAIPNRAVGVRRKPLPSSPILGLGDHPQPPPEVNPYFQTYSSGPTGNLPAGRKPVSQGNVDEHRRMDANPPLPDRKLLGPRPMNQLFLSVDNPPLHDVPERQNIDLRRWSEQPAGTLPRLPPRPFSGGKDNLPMVPPRPLAASLKDSFVANGRHSRFLRRKPIAYSVWHDVNRKMKDGSNAKDLQSASLSLIRRYNNEQWNVGKISSKGTKPTVSGFGESSPGISIRILTHGYSKFIDPINSFAKQGLTVANKSNGTRDSHTPITAAGEKFYFQRDLQVSGHAMRNKAKLRPSETQPPELRIY
ncbi:MAG: hypothetical protein ASARMPREDX12_008497 [Alectoria sarmentosa]|nr:MAG: hypothetical protein ASARMPREDX12_008497 [Alectoria sarmentosa]